MYNNICTGDMDQVEERQAERNFESTCLDLDVTFYLLLLLPFTTRHERACFFCGQYFTGHRDKSIQ
jgi:hypothetical protein